MTEKELEAWERAAKMATANEENEEYRAGQGILLLIAEVRRLRDLLEDAAETERLRG